MANPGPGAPLRAPGLVGDLGDDAMTFTAPGECGRGQAENSDQRRGDRLHWTDHEASLLSPRPSSVVAKMQHALNLSVSGQASTNFFDAPPSKLGPPEQGWLHSVELPIHDFLKDWRRWTAMERLIAAALMVAVLVGMSAAMAINAH
jgi:hypothetical protein